MIKLVAMKKSNGIVEIFSLIGLIVLAVALPLLNKTIKSSQDKRNLATETEVTGMCGIINAKCCETGTKCLLGDCDTDGYCKPPFSKPSDGPTPVPTRKFEPPSEPIKPIYCGGHGEKCCPGDKPCRFEWEYCDEDNQCWECGDSGDKCCPGKKCKNRLGCIDDKCEEPPSTPDSCEAERGDPCCPGNKCKYPKETCIKGICELCGSEWEPCCTDGSCDNDQFQVNTCLSDKKCHPNGYLCQKGVSSCKKYMALKEDFSDLPAPPTDGSRYQYYAGDDGKNQCEKNCTCNKVNDDCCMSGYREGGIKPSDVWCDNGLKCSTSYKCYNPVPIVCQKGKYSCDLVKDKGPNEIGCDGTNTVCYENTADAITKCKKECSTTIVCQKGKYSCDLVSGKSNIEIGCGGLNTECYGNAKDAVSKCKKDCTCSKAGDNCCLSFDSKRMFCENELGCGSDKKCRVVCGKAGEPCCEGDSSGNNKCEALLGCNPSNNTCQYLHYECNRRQFDSTKQCIPTYDTKTGRPGQCDLPTATCYDYPGICKMNCEDCGKIDHICCTASDGKSRYCTNNLSCNRTPTPGAPGDALCQRQTCGMSGESCPGPGDPEITNTPTPTSTPIISKPKTPATCVKNKGSYSGSGPDIIGGDYDCNGVTNIGDYSVWRKEFVDKQKWKGASNWWTDIDGDGDLNNDSGYSRWRNALFR